VVTPAAQHRTFLREGYASPVGVTPAGAFSLSGGNAMTEYAFEASLKAVLAKLDELPAEIKKNVVRGALRAAAKLARSGG